MPAYGIVVEKDVDVPMRDGARLKADVFRPDDAGKFPAILNLGPYQKDKLWVPPETLEEKPNPLMNWETVNPQWWVPKGYAAVRVDGRGSGKSPGQCEPWSLAESIDFYDAIEWAAAQPWCSGKVGLSGISYFAINQWFVANHQPPSLKAIIPWEGFADLYRDALFHGGILSLFMPNWFVAHLMHHLVGRASRHHPNAWQTNTLHFWLRQQPRQRRLPRRAGAMGQDHGADVQRRQLVGHGDCICAATPRPSCAPRRKHKKLRIHAGTHVHPFYTEDGRRDQLRFFDYWLKGIDNGVMDEPPVKLAIRKGRDEVEWRARARVAACAHAMDQVLFRSVEDRARHGREYRQACRRQSRDAEIAHLCRDQPGLDGFDLRGIVAGDGRRHQARHGGRAGDAAAGAGCRGHRTGRRRAVGLELDRGHGSVPHAPQHRRRRQRGAGDRPAGRAGAGGERLAARLAPRARSGAVVAVSPVSHASAAALSDARRDRRGRGRDLADLDGVRKGHRIRLDIQPRDGVGSASYMHYHADYNTGTNTIHAGGERESYLLLPVIPEPR